MKNPSVTAKLTFGQKLNVFVKQSPARMAFIIAVFIYAVTVIINPNAFNASAIGSIIMLTLLLMTPTVFLIVRRVFDLGDKAVARLRSLRKAKR